MNANLWHYDSLSGWNEEYYKDVFLPTHLVGDEISIEDPSTGESLFFYVAKKNKQLYLLPSEILEEGELPIRVKKTDKIAYKGKAYHQVIQYISVRVREECTMSYKQMIDSWLDYEHDNKKAFTMWKIIVDAWYSSRINVRVITFPGWLKDSPTTTLSLIRGDCTTLNKPSLAKLKYLLNSSLKGLGLNEIQKIDAEERTQLAKFYEDVGDFKPVYINPTRSAHGTQEQCNITNLSTFTFSNFPDSKKPYEEQQKEIFDNNFEPKVRQRIFPLLFTGGDEKTPACKQRFSHKSEKITPEQVNEITTWLRNHIYYEKHGKELALAKGFKNNYFIQNTRWDRNFQAISERIALYADTQAEFDEFTKLLYICNKQYEDWLDKGIIPGSPERQQTTLAKPIPIEPQQQIVVEEVIDTPEILKSPRDRLYEAITKEAIAIDELEKKFPAFNMDNMLKEMMKVGDIFEPRRGFVARL